MSPKEGAQGTGNTSFPRGTPAGVRAEISTVEGSPPVTARHVSRNREGKSFQPHLSSELSRRRTEGGRRRGRSRGAGQEQDAGLGTSACASGPLPRKPRDLPAGSCGFRFGGLRGGLEETRCQQVLWRCWPSHHAESHPLW